jgi:hypothetical protein
MTRLVRVAVVAVAAVLIGVAHAPPSMAQVPPPVVTIAATGGVLTRVIGCSGTSTYSLQRARFTLTRTGDLTQELFVDTATGGSIENIPNVGEGIVIPAGASTGIFEPDTGTADGTVQIEIANVSHPGTFTVGKPSSAVATITEVTAADGCGSTTTTTTNTGAATAPEVDAAPADPVRATPSFTG